MIGAPSVPTLRDSTQRAFWEILEAEDISYQYFKADNRIVFDETQSEIIFRSLENPELLRGPNLAWFAVDELTYARPQAWSRLLGRLRHPKASRLCGFAAWTPKGFDWVYQDFVSKPKPGYTAYLASPRENQHVAETGLYDSLASSYDDRFYRQEVLGEYLNVFSGQAYYAFDRAKNVQPIPYQPGGGPLCWSLDFNVNPMCSVIGQMVTSRTPLHGLSDAQFNVLDEIHLEDSNTPQACEEFIGRSRQYRRDGMPLLVNVYGDATGSKRTSANAGSLSDWSAVKERLSREPGLLVSYKYGAGNPLQKDRVASVNAALRNSLGVGRCHIDPQCSYLVRDLERVTWKAGSSILDQETDRMLTHISDALGYWIEKEASVSRQQGGFRSGFIA